MAPPACTAMLWPRRGSENHSFVQQILNEDPLPTRHCCRRWELAVNETVNLCSSRACFLVRKEWQSRTLIHSACVPDTVPRVLPLLTSAGRLRAIIFISASQRGELSIKQSINLPGITKLLNGRVGIWSQASLCCDSYAELLLRSFFNVRGEVFKKKSEPSKGCRQTLWPLELGTGRKERS